MKLTIALCLAAVSLAQAQISHSYNGSSSGAAAATNFSTRKALYVSKGVAATDIRGSYSKYSSDVPFATPTAAKSAAASGDLIVVEPGTWDEHDLFKNGVDWYFQPGAIISYTGTSGSVFDDSATGANGAVTCSIMGAGTFIASGSKSVFWVSNSSSNVTVECDTIDRTTESNDVQFVAVTHKDGYLSVRANIIRAWGGTWYWDGGEGHTVASKIENYGTGAALYVANARANQHWYVDAQLVAGTAANASAFSMSDSDPTSRAWVKAQRMTTTNAAVVTMQSGIAYITTQKLDGPTDGSAPVVNLEGTAKLYLKTDKIEGGGSDGGALSFFDTSTSFIDIGEAVDTGLTDSALVNCNGGTHQLRIGTVTRATAGDGIGMGGGTLILRQSRINTANSSSYNPINKTGGTLILDGATLLAEGTRNSIEATTAQNVVVYSAFANKAVDADVTQKVGTVTVSADAQ